MRISQIWMQIRILHAALLGSVLIYGVVVVIVTRQPAPASQLDASLMLPVLGGVGAALLLVLLPFLRQRMMPAREAFPGEAADLDVEPDERVTAALTKLRVALILTWALCESVGVLGLIAGFLFREPLYFAPFGAVAIGAMVAYAPRHALLDAVVRAARRT